MQIYLAPMEGITGHVVRNAFYHNFGYIDKYFTPFIPAAKSLSRKIKRDIDPANNEGIRLVPQLISNRSDEVLDMIRQLKDRGFSEFNLNLGCPSGTVVNKKRGSGMLRYPEELDQFLYEIYENADVPLSVKTRIGFNDLEDWPAILAVYRKYPISELIIHPRLRKEMYTGFPHLEAFGEAYHFYCDSGIVSLARQSTTDSGQSTSAATDQRDPVDGQCFPTHLCYNGDIWDTDCYKRLMEQFPAVDTVMIGRGLLGRPDLACCIKGVELSDTRDRIKDFCHEIYDGYLSIFSGEKDVCMHMKEIWASLCRSFVDSDRLLRKLMKTQTASEFKHIQEQILDTLELSKR